MMEATERGFADGFGKVRRVLVVGAGVAGLQTARSLLKAGFRVLVIEQQPDIGGGWHCGAGGAWQLNQFPEFPCTQAFQFKNGEPCDYSIEAYVKAYARHFNVYKHIKFGCKLVRLLRRRGKSGWKAAFQEVGTGTLYCVCVDYTVVCTGVCSEPFMPEVEGAAEFQGVSLHAKDFGAHVDIKDKAVVLVGGGKSAADCASLVTTAKSACSVKVIYRQLPWPVPAPLSGNKSLLHSPLFQRLLPPYYESTSRDRFLSRCLQPVKHLVWRAMESSVRRKVPGMSQVKPARSLCEDLLLCNRVDDPEYDSVLYGDNVQKIRGGIKTLAQNGIISSEGEFHRADVVIFCTGYVHTYSYLDSTVLQNLGVSKDGLYLYRNVLPPNVPNLAFVGSEVTSFNHLLTTALQAKWLAKVLTDKTQLPSRESMLEDIEKQKRWRREVMPSQFLRASVINGYMLDYHKQLLNDMQQHRNQRASQLCACLSATTADDFSDVFNPDPFPCELLPCVKENAAATNTSSSTFTVVQKLSTRTDLDLLPADSLRVATASISDCDDMSLQSLEVSGSLFGSRPSKHRASVQAGIHRLSSNKSSKSHALGQVSGPIQLPKVQSPTASSSTASPAREARAAAQQQTTPELHPIPPSSKSKSSRPGRPLSTDIPSLSPGAQPSSSSSTSQLDSCAGGRQAVAPGGGANELQFRNPYDMDLSSVLDLRACGSNPSGLALQELSRDVFDSATSPHNTAERNLCSPLCTTEQNVVQMHMDHVVEQVVVGTF